MVIVRTEYLVTWRVSLPKLKTGFSGINVDHQKEIAMEVQIMHCWLECVCVKYINLSMLVCIINYLFVFYSKCNHLWFGLSWPLTVWIFSVVANKNYYAVRNAGCVSSRNTRKLTPNFFELMNEWMNQLINQVHLEQLTHH